MFLCSLLCPQGSGEKVHRSVLSDYISEGCQRWSFHVALETPMGKVGSQAIV